MEQTEKVDTFAIVEVMGRQTYAGRVSEQVFAGTGFVRVDVPEVNGNPGFTKLIGTGSIYAITPTTEDVVRRYLEYHRPVPMSVYIPPERRLPEPGKPVRPPHPCADCGSDCFCDREEGHCSLCGACDPDEIDDEDEDDERDRGF